MNNPMKASDYIAELLVRKRVRAVFELVGGMTTHMIDSLYARPEVKIISMHHEQGAAFAADAAGRITGTPAVALATSGPGAINLLTGIGSCYFDSTPAVFLTGQVNRDEQKRGRRVRQLGFQEADVVSMAQPVTKKASKVENVEELPGILEEAFVLAADGRPGPVLVDIPMDIQRASLDPAQLPAFVPTKTPAMEYDFAVLADALLQARKPLILAGGGIRSGLAVPVFRELLETLRIPVVHSLMGVDVLSYEHPANAGMIGSYGNRWANLALAQCDCLLVLGSRLDVRQTGSDTEGFKTGRQIFHIDCDAAEVNNRITGCHTIVSHLHPALQALTEELRPAAARIEARTRQWCEQICALRQQWPDTAELAGIEGINPNIFMHELSRSFRDVAVYVVDVGQHQMWAAQSLEVDHGQRFLTSGGMGSMGFALPAAVGASVALGGERVMLIAGDGAFQCNIQELETIVHLGLPVKMVVINNQCLGMVRQFQESYFGKRYQSTVWGYSAPNFEAVAAAYGIPARSISKEMEVAEAARWLHGKTHGPQLLQVMVSHLANAYPKLAFGKGLSCMEPQEKPLDMEST